MTILLSERLKKLRAERNFTQEIVATRIGVTRAMVSSYENSLRQPSLDVLISLARLYRVSTDYLLGVDTTKPIVIYGMDERQTAVINDMADLLADADKGKRIPSLREAI